MLIEVRSSSCFFLLIFILKDAEDASSGGLFLKEQDLQAFIKAPKSDA